MNELALSADILPLPASTAGAWEAIIRIIGSGPSQYVHKDVRPPGIVVKGYPIGYGQLARAIPREATFLSSRWELLNRCGVLSPHF